MTGQFTENQPRRGVTAMSATLTDLVTNAATMLIGDAGCDWGGVWVGHPAAERWVFRAGAWQATLTRVERTWVLIGRDQEPLGTARHLYGALGLALCEADAHP